MSKIITDWVCEHCGHTKNEYVSFGHPEQSFIYRWKCEKCGGENSCEIEEWISSRGPQNEVTIYRGAPTTMFRIFRTDCGEELIAIPSSQFDCKDFEDEEMAECLGQYRTKHGEAECVKIDA